MSILLNDWRLAALNDNLAYERSQPRCYHPVIGHVCLLKPTVSLASWWRRLPWRRPPCRAEKDHMARNLQIAAVEAGASILSHGTQGEYGRQPLHPPKP
jgi:hypothetical protein